MTDNSDAKRIALIFMCSLIITIAGLYIGRGLKNQIVHQRMTAFSIASARASDGAPNLIVMNGIPGYLGESSVYLKYMDDGYIKLTGDNPQESREWKKLCKFGMEAGHYTLTGLSGVEENTIALQLRISDETGYYCYIYQWDEDVSITVERPAEAALHVMVYPFAEGIDAMARPAVYRDE